MISIVSGYELYDISFISSQIATKTNYFGHKYFQEYQLEEEKKRKELEDEKLYQLRLRELERINSTIKEQLTNHKEQFDFGDWDSKYTNSGFYYDTKDKDSIILKNEEVTLKMLPQAITNTESNYIDKIVYIVRHPDECGDFQRTDELITQTYDYFINSTLMFLEWKEKHPDIPVKIVFREDFYKNNDLYSDIGDFMGIKLEPFSFFELSINDSGKTNLLYNNMKEIYNLLRDEKYDDILIHFKDKNENKSNRSFTCIRSDEQVNESICKKCKSNKNFRKIMRDNSEKKEIDWKNEPCGYEVGMSSEDDHITIEESIKNNFWRE